MTSRTHRSNTYTRQTPKAGTGVFAANDIGPGELIFRVDRPLVSALDSPHLKDTCYSCYLWVPENQSEDEGEYDGVGMLKLKACTGCRIARYCGQVSFGAWSTANTTLVGFEVFNYYSALSISAGLSLLVLYISNFVAIWSRFFVLLFSFQPKKQNLVVVP
jgi:Pyruvate/2-oxoacid:ferredoxin oxidoreductase delta subunit